MKTIILAVLLASAVKLSAFDDLDFEQIQESPLPPTVTVPGWRHIGALNRSSGGGNYWNVNGGNLSGWAEATVIDSAPPLLLPRQTIADRFSIEFNYTWFGGPCAIGSTTRDYLGESVTNYGYTGNEDISRAWIAQTGTVLAGQPWLTLLTDYTGPTEPVAPCAPVGHGGKGGFLSIYFNNTRVAYTLESQPSAGGSSKPLQQLRGDLRPFVGQTGELRIGIEGPESFLIDNIAFVPMAIEYNYTTNNGTITITGYTCSNAVATIPSMIDGLPVRTIASTAFLGCTNLTSMTIPNSVTSIEDSAFLGCTGLTSVMIANSVTNIGDTAFAYCTSLANVMVPRSVTAIGNYSFYGCINLTGVYFEGNAPLIPVGFAIADRGTIYYLAETIGWGTTFGGRPTALWNPQSEGLNVGVRLIPEISVFGYAGALGQVEWRETLGPGVVWQLLTNVTVGTDGVTVVDLAVGATTRFYRAVTVPPAPGGMAVIPAGSFQMGDSFAESYELPVHSVFVSAFYMDKTEMTKAQWDTVKGWGSANGYGFDNPGDAKAANHPVQAVSWYDAVKWCNARSQKGSRTPAYYTDAALTQVYKTGRVDPYVKWDAGYRLPTEAEWEKAARGGASAHRFPWSDTDTITHSRANYNSDSRYPYDVSPTRGFHPTYAVGSPPYTSPVGSFAANGYGLYDMAGNVLEWCWDWYSSYSIGPERDPRGPAGPASGSFRMFRGGGWGSGAIFCRSAGRSSGDPGYGDGNFGFRSVLSAVSSSSNFDSSVTLSGLIFGPVLTDIGGPLDFVSVPKFNGGLLAQRDIDCPPGRVPFLKTVTLLLSGQISAVGSVGNKNQNDPIDVTVTMAGPFILSTPSATNLLTANPSLSTGVISVKPGQTTGFGPIGAGALATNTAPIVDFLGTGNVHMPVTSAVSFSLQCPCSPELLFSHEGDGIFGTVVVDVTYDYTCVDGPPPWLHLNVRLVPEITVSGTAGAAAQVEWSATTGAGAEWQVLTNVTAGPGDLVTVIDFAAGSATRVYRAVPERPIPDGMALVPSGSFQRGDTFNDGYNGEIPVHAVFVSAVPECHTRRACHTPPNPRLRGGATKIPRGVPRQGIRKIAFPPFSSVKSEKNVITYSCGYGST